MLLKYSLNVNRFATSLHQTFGIIHRNYSIASSASKPCLLNYLKQRIKATGPITVASYMKEALTHPMLGYYMQKDVFGKKGDFTTSPEISQLFGELLGVWYFSQWLSMGKPTQLRFVELGPGRGTLMADILRVFKQLLKEDMKLCISVHLVEVSSKMKDLQTNTLNVIHLTENKGVTDSGIAVEWHSHVHEVPKGNLNKLRCVDAVRYAVVQPIKVKFAFEIIPALYTYEGTLFYIAHEFFDALPVHLCRKVEKQWRELLVNFSSERNELEYVISPASTPVTQTFTDPLSTVNECEICPEAAVIMKNICDNITKHGGCALIVDYGDVINNRHSIRGFQDHKLMENILKNPGTMDITANVDFGFLRKISKGYCHGPITQQTFLIRMGVKRRVESLLINATQQQAQSLLSAYEYLLSSDKMGEKFKVMAITDSKTSNPPAF